MIVFCFISITNSNAQTDIDAKLKSLFFDLNIDSCEYEIVKSIRDKIDYNEYKDELDSIITEKYFFIQRKYYHSFKLLNNEKSIIKCDSTSILFQPAYLRIVSSHGKPDYEKLYGHIVSIFMYVSDSTEAYKSYRNLADSIANSINRELYFCDFTVNGVVGGNRTTINIDKKNNGYEYERILGISIRKYDTFYVVELQFSKHTIIPEICYDE